MNAVNKASILLLKIDEHLREENCTHSIHEVVREALGGLENEAKS